MRLVKMPRLGQDMEEGTLVEWAKSVGDEVSEGEILAVIETDKAEVAFESPAGGYLVAVLAEAGSTLATGEPIAWIADDPSAKPPSPGSVPASSEEAPGARSDSHPGGRHPKDSAEAGKAQAGLAPGPPPGKGTGSRSGRRRRYGSGGKGHRG